MAVRALLIDDDARLADLLRRYLAGHEVILHHAPDGASGLSALARGGVDVVLLDITLPGSDGLEVLRRLRERSSVPVLMLTARGDEADRVVGLELGADDYLAKPAFPRELLARIRAVLRRSAPTGAERPLLLGDLELRPGAREARLAGEPLGLTALEFDLLLALVSRAGRVLSREALWEAAGRSDTQVGARTVDVHVSRLRAKLGEAMGSWLKTVRGAGYLFTREAP